MRSLLVGAATFGFGMVVVSMYVWRCFDRIKQPIMIQVLEDIGLFYVGDKSVCDGV